MILEDKLRLLLRESYVIALSRALLLSLYVIVHKATSLS
jgi:hypothetical protein